MLLSAKQQMQLKCQSCWDILLQAKSYWLPDKKKVSALCRCTARVVGDTIINFIKCEGEFCSAAIPSSRVFLRDLHFKVSRRDVL